MDQIILEPPKSDLPETPPEIEFFTAPRPVGRSKNPLNILMFQAALCATVLAIMLILKAMFPEIYNVANSYISLYIYA